MKLRDLPSDETSLCQVPFFSHHPQSPSKDFEIYFDARLVFEVIKINPPTSIFSLPQNQPLQVMSQ